MLFAAALEHGYSPVSVLSDLGHVPPQGPEEWSPRNVEADAPDTLTLRAALLESDNRAATLLQHQLGSRPVLRLASDPAAEGPTSDDLLALADAVREAARPTVAALPGPAAETGRDVTTEREAWAR